MAADDGLQLPPSPSARNGRTPAYNVMAQAPPGKLGLTMKFLQGDDGRVDATVAHVHPACPFRESVQEGDKLLRINGREVRTADDLAGRIMGDTCGKAAWALAQRYFDGSIAS